MSPVWIGVCAISTLKSQQYQWLIITMIENLPEIKKAHDSLSGYIIGDYVCHKSLGDGSFATVYKASLLKNETDMFAIKVIDKSKYMGLNEAKQLQLLISEANAMAICDSDYIVKCHKQYQTSSYMIFVLEYCNGKSLYDEITTRGKIPENEAKRILKQLVKAFAEMHSKKIIHRDLKPENIFKHNQKYKIGDFGFCKIFKSLNDLTATPLGTLITMAPEVLDGKPYDIKADLWSLGCVYYEMLFGKPPYISNNFVGMKRVINKGDISYEGISKNSADFLRKIFVADPKDRLAWSELELQPLFRAPSMVMPFEHKDDVDISPETNFFKSLEKMQGTCNKEYNQQLESIYTIKELVEDDMELVSDSQKKKFHQRGIEDDRKVVSMLSYKDKLNFEMQKSVFILQQIVEPIETCGVDLDREHAELKFLALMRCFYIMSPLSDALLKNKNIFEWDFYDEFLVNSNHKSFLKDFRVHYEVLRVKKEETETLVQGYEGRWGNKTKDFFRRNIFSRTKYARERVFLEGLERMDYKPEEHTDFIQEEYIMKMVNKLEDVASKGAKHLRLALKEYPKVAMLNYQNGQGRKELSLAYLKVLGK